MKNKTILEIIFFISFIFGNWFYFKSLLANQETIEQTDLENYLRTARIISVDKNIEGGRTAPWIIRLDDGKMRLRGIFKHVNRHRPALLPDSYKYEIAAYELAKLIAFDLVPAVVEREIKGLKGSLQIYLENCMAENERKRRNIAPPNPKVFENILEEIKVFENLVYDECQNTDDILINKEDWRVWRVDFSEAFSPSPDLIPGCEISRCSKKFYQNLLKLDDNVLKTKLKPYLNEEEIKALLERKTLIIEKIKKLIQEKGEEAVLFS
jgi:hypothetical protein